jgi:hypothetical protein
MVEHFRADKFHLVAELWPQRLDRQRRQPLQVVLLVHRPHQRKALTLV